MAQAGARDVIHYGDYYLESVMTSEIRWPLVQGSWRAALFLPNAVWFGLMWAKASIARMSVSLGLMSAEPFVYFTIQQSVEFTSALVWKCLIALAQKYYQHLLFSLVTY